MELNKRVLVTGSTGFVGRATVAALLEKGWQVTQGTRINSNKKLEGFIYLDFDDPETIISLTKKHPYDAIVHLGAHIGLSGATESEMFIPNVLSTGCLAYLAHLWDAHLVFASTAIVHGIKNERISLESPILPDSAYAKSKWLGEQLLWSSNVRHCVLRIAGVFGCDGPTHLGLNRAIDEAVKGEVPNQIGSGTALRNYIYVKDVAQAIHFALIKKIEGSHLLAGNETSSISEMLQKVCNTFLPGMHPVINDGVQAVNQVITPSKHFPQTMSFNDALIDIKKECYQ